MRKGFLAGLFIAAIFACSTPHSYGFGPGDPWVTTAPTGLLANYPGQAAAPAIRSLDGGVQANFLTGAPDLTDISLTFTAAGLDIGDSGIFTYGNSVAGVVSLFWDGGEVGTATALATVNLPWFFPDAGGLQGGFTVDCKHTHGVLGLTEGPLELAQAVYCVPQLGDGGNGGGSNQFTIYAGPNPLATPLSAIAHDAGAGLFQIQYSILGW